MASREPFYASLQELTLGRRSLRNYTPNAVLKPCNDELRLLSPRRIEQCPEFFHAAAVDVLVKISSRFPRRVYARTNITIRPVVMGNWIIRL